MFGFPSWRNKAQMAELLGKGNWVWFLKDRLGPAIKRHFSDPTLKVFWSKWFILKMLVLKSPSRAFDPVLASGGRFELEGLYFDRLASLSGFSQGPVKCEFIDPFARSARDFVY